MLKSKKNVQKVKRNRRPEYYPLTRQQIIAIADKGVGWDFNRQLDSEGVRTFSKDARFVLDHRFHHSHRHFKPCEHHHRLVIAYKDGHNSGLLFADVPVSYFETLVRQWGKRPPVMLMGQSMLDCVK